MAPRKHAPPPTPAPIPPTGRLIDLHYVLTDLGFESASTIYRLIANGEYPAPLKIGRNSRWRLEDHEAYKASLSSGKAAAPKSPGRPKQPRREDDPLAA